MKISFQRSVISWKPTTFAAGLIAYVGNIDGFFISAGIYPIGLKDFSFGIGNN